MITRAVALLGACLSACAFASELDATAWRLVNIASMDDTVHVPDDSARYTLELQPDGRASIRADCNRGTGTWTSEDASRLTFGAIAATRPMCTPGSLSDTYLAQFEWVRSYVLRDGHLFLATMADGSIIEFEPLPPVVAVVLGLAVRTTDPAELRDAVLTRLFDTYAQARGIPVSEQEVDAYVEHLRRGKAAIGLTAAERLTAEEAAQVDAINRNLARSLIRQWKINRLLYEVYGGRIVYQQLGPEPLDAYREYLGERQRAGDFDIQDPEMAEHFWRYFTDDSIHDVMESGGADESHAFISKPWEET
jgi:heat shock protein HslJ